MVEWDTITTPPLFTFGLPYRVVRVKVGQSTSPPLYRWFTVGWWGWDSLPHPSLPLVYRRVVGVGVGQSTSPPLYRWFTVGWWGLGWDSLPPSIPLVYRGWWGLGWDSLPHPLYTVGLPWLVGVGGAVYLTPSIPLVYRRVVGVGVGQSASLYNVGLPWLVGVGVGQSASPPLYRWFTVVGGGWGGTVCPPL